MALSDFEIWTSAASRPYIGDDYYTPPEECFSLGRELSCSVVEVNNPDHINLSAEGEPTYFVSDLWARLSSQLEAGEWIFGGFLRRLFREDVQQAVLIFDQERMIEFEAQVFRGDMVRIGYFALSDEQAKAGLARPASKKGEES